MPKPPLLQQQAPTQYLSRNTELDIDQIRFFHLLNICNMATNMHPDNYDNTDNFELALKIFEALIVTLIDDKYREDRAKINGYNTELIGLIMLLMQRKNKVDPLAYESDIC